MQIYVASGLENASAVASLCAVLEAQGHTITYKWYEHGSVEREGDLRIAEVAMAEIEGVRRADVVIVLLPGGKGTHTELGCAIGLRTERGFSARPEILLVGFEKSRATDKRTCAFWLHPLVRHVSSVDSAISYCAYLSVP